MQSERAARLGREHPPPLSISFSHRHSRSAPAGWPGGRRRRPGRGGPAGRPRKRRPRAASPAGRGEAVGKGRRERGWRDESRPSCAGRGKCATAGPTRGPAAGRAPRPPRHIKAAPGQPPVEAAGGRGNAPTAPPGPRFHSNRRAWAAPSGGGGPISLSLSVSSPQPPSSTDLDQEGLGESRVGRACVRVGACCFGRKRESPRRPR